ncbi:OPT super [Dipsacomyces acuminosporus]|nr:OPT super [Dipsacomyces acuminosporus]
MATRQPISSWGRRAWNAFLWRAPDVDAQDGQYRRRKYRTVDETQTHFTWRAVIVGLFFGTILCFSNMYFGLQTGWISMMSLQSSLVGFAVFKALERVLDIPFGPAENVVLQTTAVAAATMPLAGGFVGILPALKQLEPKESHGARTELNYGQLCAWGLALAFFGVFFAVPLRKQAIIREKLRFPSGTATAQMISLLHNRPDPTFEEDLVVAASSVSGNAPSQSGELRRRTNASGARAESSHGSIEEEREADQPSPAHDTQPASAVVDDVKWVIKLLLLFFSFLLSGAYTLLANYFPIISALPVFGNYLSKTNGGGNGGQQQTDGSNAARRSYGSSSDASSSQAKATATTTEFANPDLAKPLIAEGTPSDGDDDGDGDVYDDLDDGDVDPRYLVPGWVIWGGLLASTLICMGVVKAIFNVPLYDTLIAVILALPLAVIAVRALGETDLNPVSGIGKFSQVVFAGVMPGNLVGNLVAGGIAEAGAQQAGDLMQDLKTGHLLRASPRAQFVGQMIGSVYSVFISAAAYQLYNKVYTIPSQQFPVPTGQVWLDMARLVNGQALPTKVWPFVVGFAVLFAVLPCISLWIEYSGRKSFKLGKWTVPTSTVQRWWPSGIAFAIGIYNTPNFTLMRAIGAIVVTIVTEALVKSRKSRHVGSSSGSALPAVDEALYRRKIGMLAIILASGFVLGEGTFSFFILLGKAFSKK